MQANQLKASHHKQGNLKCAICNAGLTKAVVARKGSDYICIGVDCWNKQKTDVSKLELELLIAGNEAALHALPHPNDFLASKGESLLGYARYCADKGGKNAWYRATLLIFNSL